jgi:hypothetical protein
LGGDVGQKKPGRKATVQDSAFCKKQGAFRGAGTAGTEGKRRMTKARPKEIWDKDFHVAPAGFVLPEKIIRERGDPIRPEIEASEVGRKEAQMTQKTKPRASFPIFASFVPFGGQPPGAGLQP